jgi:hypothetical protein
VGLNPLPLNQASKLILLNGTIIVNNLFLIRKWRRRWLTFYYTFPKIPALEKIIFQLENSSCELSKELVFSPRKSDIESAGLVSKSKTVVR